MRVLCTSDIHRNHVFAGNILKTIKDEKIDVFINAGDFLDNSFAYDFLSKLKVRSFIVQGNWDMGLNFNNKYVTVDNFGVFPYGDYHFMCIGGGFPFSAEDATDIVKDIDSNRLIIITHYPPYGILDRAWSNTHAGYPEYRKFLEEKKPSLHVFGHIHESNGTKKLNGTLAINCALADYGEGRGYIVDLPDKSIKPVNLNETESNTPLKFQSTISRIIRKREQDLP